MTLLAVLRYAACGLLGVVIGVIGTAVHRWEQPWGLVLALACVLSGALLTRAWTGWVGPLALAMGLVMTVGALALEGPGGDVLVAAQPVGYIWYAGALMAAAAALAPRRWFSDRPVGEDRPTGPST